MEIALDNLLCLDLDMEHVVLVVSKVLDVQNVQQIHKVVEFRKVHGVIDLQEHVVKTNYTK